MTFGNAQCKTLIFHVSEKNFTGNRNFREIFTWNPKNLLDIGDFALGIIWCHLRIYMKLFRVSRYSSANLATSLLLDTLLNRVPWILKPNRRFCMIIKMTSGNTQRKRQWQNVALCITWCHLCNIHKILSGSREHGFARCLLSNIYLSAYSTLDWVMLYKSEIDGGTYKHRWEFPIKQDR